MLFYNAACFTALGIRTNTERTALDVSGSLAQHHFQLYHIYPNFFLTLRTVQRKLDKDRILIHLRSCFALTNRAMYPQGFFSIVVHFNTSNVGIAPR